jgi:hypothetical protein
MGSEEESAVSPLVYGMPRALPVKHGLRGAAPVPNCRLEPGRMSAEKPFRLAAYGVFAISA